MLQDAFFATSLDRCVPMPEFRCTSHHWHYQRARWSDHVCAHGHGRKTKCYKRTSVRFQIFFIVLMCVYELVIIVLWVVDVDKLVQILDIENSQEGNIGGLLLNRLSFIAKQTMEIVIHLIVLLILFFVDLWLISVINTCRIYIRDKTYVTERLVMPTHVYNVVRSAFFLTKSYTFRCHHLCK